MVETNPFSKSDETGDNGSPTTTSPTSNNPFSKDGGSAAGFSPYATTIGASGYSYRPDITFEKDENTVLSGVLSGFYSQLTGKELPPTHNQVPQIAQAIKAIESDTIGGAIDGFLRSAVDFATTPEFILALSAFADRTMEQEPLRAIIKYDGTVGDVLRAAHTTVGIEAYEPVNAQEQPNVSAAFDLARSKIKPETKDFLWSLMSSLPADQRGIPKTPDEIRTDNENAQRRALSPTLIPLVGKFFGDQSIEGEERSVRGDAFRNYREEVAAQLYIYLDDNPIETEEDERELITWLWKTTEGKWAEIKGRESHLGELGGPLDLPRAGMSNLATKALGAVSSSVGVLGQTRAPNDALENVHLSWGQNIAYIYGTAPGDDAGWAKSGPGKAILQGISGTPAAMFPATWPVSAYRLATSEENPMVGVPGWSSFLEQQGNASNWEWISGGSDLMGNIFLDPINYVANVGFGVKSAKVTLRAAQASKAKLAMQALVPFYGVHATGVRYPATARLTWVFMSKTIDEGIDAMKLSSKGKRLFQAVSTMSGPEEVMQKVDGLAGRPDVAKVLLSESMNGNYDMFWETIRVNMHGGNSTREPIKSMQELTRILDSGDVKFHNAVQQGLDEGRVGIRDAMDPTTGVAHAHPYEVVQTPGTRVEPRMARGETEIKATDEVTRKDVLASTEAILSRVGKETNEFITLPDGTRLGVHRLGSGRELALTDENGRVVSAIINDSIGTATDWERRGAMTELLKLSTHDIDELAKPGHRPISISEAGAGVLNKALGQTVDTDILRISSLEGDGVRKVAINSKRGFETISPVDNSLGKWLTDNGHTDLAAKLQQAGNEALAGTDQVSLFDFRISDLADGEIGILRRYLDDVSDAHAFGHGDELLLGNRAEGKLLSGIDSDVRVPLEEALPDEAHAQAMNYAARQVASGDGHDQLTLIHQMPRLSRLSPVRRISGTNRVAQFWRRAGFGVTVPKPTFVDVGNRITGGNDMRRYMELLGVSPEGRRTIMDKWWNAASDEERYAILKGAEAMIADDLSTMPSLKYGLIDHNRLRGEKSYGRDASGTEIGVAARADGTETVVPTLKAHMNTEIPLIDAAKLNRQRKRYIKARRLPKTLTNGFGVTKKRRNELVVAYKAQIKRTDPKLLEAISDDELLNIAYADVLGFQGRANGLSVMNRAATVGGKAYGAFHSVFTIAQLAFRPFPWAGRVLLEEQVRAWMMGLPTVYRNPVQFGVAFWDSHWIRALPAKLEKQQAAAERSARSLFAGDVALIGEAVQQADEIIPGFAAKIKKSNITDGNSIRAIYSHELSKALIGTPRSLDIASRGNMSIRTMFRDKRITKVAGNLDKRYNIELDFDFFADVPEIINKSNVWMLSDEMQSSVKPMSWTPEIRQSDIYSYADGYTKKLQQIIGDRAGSFAIRRMSDKMAGLTTENTVQRFTQKQYWLDIRSNIRDVARNRGMNVDVADAPNYVTDLKLAEFYLDTIVADEWIKPMVRPFWGTDMNEKARILDELANGRKARVFVGDTEHLLDARSSKYSQNKASHRTLFQDEHMAGNFEFPTVSAYLHPLYGQGNLPGVGQYVRRFTNKVMETFGEKASLALHREPSYLFERRLWSKQMQRLGWDEASATHLAHQKATEMVNYTFFNNQHTGFIINRMNKAIPFFSAWAEVMSTWAWKIPSQNYLPLGYARMFHTMDKVMQSFVKMGLVDIGDDGQWHLNLDSDPSQLSATGRGLSQGMMEWVQAPVNVIEQFANIARWLGETYNQELGDGDSDGYKPVDFSAWKKDNYSLAIGSPVDINSHGIMGVNQFNFGGGPVINYGATKFLMNLPYAVDTELVEGDTLASMYEQLPSTVGVGEFLEINELALREHMGDEAYNTLWQSQGYLANPDLVSTEGLSLTVPGSSMMDSWLGKEVENVFFPYGHVTTAAGLIREIVPSGISYMLRGLGGIYVNEGDALEGLVTAITGPMEEYQISGEIAKQIIHLESTEGLVTKARLMHEKLYKMAQVSGFGSVEEMRNAPLGEVGDEFTRLSQDLQILNDTILKRANDNAGMSIMARGFMGFMAPATPRMMFQEEEIKGQWWGTREMADAARVRGSVQWSDAVGEMKVRDSEDIERIVLLTDAWLKDESGGTAKRWFKETYPTLLAWTNPTSYWGPGLAPPEQSGFDTFFEDVEAGRKTVYEPEVMMQRISRTAIAAGYESMLVNRFGNEPTAQVQGILENWDEYLDITQQRRMKNASLDIWDDDLNDGAYAKWRERNSEDKPVIYDAILDQLYVMRSVTDEMLALVDLANLDPEDQKTVNYSLRQIVREYMTAANEIADEMSGDPEFRNFREEALSKYFTEISGPLYEATQEEYDKLDTAETSEDRSVVFEAVKVIKNKHLAATHTVEVDGVVVQVPNELERAWKLRTDEEQAYQVIQWITRPAEWLDMFSIEKIVQTNPRMRQYLPTSSMEMMYYTTAATQKREIAEYSRLNPDQMSSYGRTQAMNEVDAWLEQMLAQSGRHAEIEWINSWPIERMMLSGQLPKSLREVGEYYVGIKQQLDSIEDGKGPTSTDGRIRFNALFFYLEDTWFPQHPQAEKEFKQLGLNVFNEGGVAAIMARLYGAYVGELS